MAISAVAVTTTDTLETFRVEFNNLVADVASIEQVGASNIIISDGGNIGSASDLDAMSIAANGVVTYTQPANFVGGLVVSNLDIDGATDIGAALADADLFIVDDGAGGTNRKAAASRIKTYIADVTLTTAAQTNITSVGTLTALDVDNININGNTISASSGAVNITPASGSAIVLDGAVNVDAGVVTGITSLTSNNILIADAGTIGSASSTSAITIASTGIVTFVDDILIKDGGTIGSASSTSAITIASSGIVTLVDDLLLKDAATIGNASVADVMTLAATGIVTFKDDIIIKDGGTIGAASATDAITIASTGIVTFVDDIIIKDAGTIGSASDTDAISISSGGVVNISATTANTGTGDGALTVAGGVGIALDASIGDDLRLISDAAILSFGANSEITVTHVHDVGLTITNTIADTDNRPTILQLKSEEDAIVADDVIASIEMAAGDSDGTDAAVVAAGIHAIAEGTFSASANATKLVFTTGVSEAAAASATAKMTLSSAGLLTIADDFVIKDGGTIGVASANDAMTISSAGIVTFKDDILIKDGGTIGVASTNDAITISSAGIVTFKDDILIKDGGTIGVASAATAITIASTGIVTFVDDIIIKDAGTIGSASDTDAISISSGGVVNISATTASTGSTSGALTVAGGMGVALDLGVGDDLRLDSDSSTIRFGVHGEILLSHVHNVGLTVTNTVNGSDDAPVILQLKSEEDAIVADDVIASIEMAAGDSDGTDGAVVAAGIHAIAEGTFAADANATKLVFTTGVSETAAASATAKMTLSSAGLLTIADDFMIKDGGTIGVASTNDAITISSAGIVTFKDDILIKDGGTIGVASATDAITIASTGIVTFVDDIIIKDAGTIGSASDTDAISISSGGVVNISATTASTSATTGALTVAGGLGVSLDAAIGDDLFMISDSAVVTFGANSEITLTHVHDVGLTVTNTIADTDNRPVVLQLKSEEDAVVADDVIASIELAAGDSDGTDGAVVAAGIHAIAEDTFSASANATKLVFTTGVSETAAASATAKMTLSSAGLLTIADDFVIKDGGTIGVASDTDAITIASDGVVTMDQIPVFSAGINVSGGTIAGTLATAAQTNITSLGTLTALTVDDINLNGKVITITGDTSDTFTITSGAAGATTFVTTDAAGADGFIKLDADGIIVLDAGDASGQTQFKISNTLFGQLFSDGSANFYMKSSASDADIIIQGIDSDAGGAFTAVRIDMSDAGSTTFTNDILLGSDSSVLKFGADSEIKLTHVHNSGLALKHTATADDNPIILTLQTGETDIAANDVIGAINFQAPDEGTGTDAILVAAGIEAVSEGDFSSSNNATKLSFKTGASEAATEKMSLSSAGLLTIADDFMIKDGGTIGVASTNDAITIASTGIVTFKDDIIIKDGGTIGSVTDADSITIASDGKVTFGQQTTHSSGILVADGGTIGSASDTDAISISSGGVVNISATTANTNATDGALTVAGGVGIALDASVGDDLRLISDGAILSFGADNDITLTHVADTGVRLSDSMALLLGTGDDISFSWDGTDGHLAVAGTLNVEGSGETLAKFIDDGAVELYHNNVKKFETTAAGVTLTGELQTTGFASSDFAAAFIVIEDGGTDGSGTDAGDNLIDETDSDDLLMENVTSWVTSGFTIRDSFGNHLQTVNGVS